LEFEIGAQLDAAQVDYEYETQVITFTEPAKSRRYTPDFILPNGIIVEAKGRWDVADRRKHKLVKEQHPELDIRFVFQNPNVKIRKGSRTSYGMWADKMGLKWAHRSIPEEWLRE